jgi:hypothetical protein
MKSSTGMQPKVVFDRRPSVSSTKTARQDAMNDRMILLLLDAKRQTVGGTDVSLIKSQQS